MATLKDQLDWEQECRERGAQVYYDKQDRLREKGRTEQTDAIQYIMHQRLREIGDELHKDVMSGKAGLQSKYSKIIRQSIEYGMSAYSMAFLGMQVVLKAMTEGKRRNHNKVTKICGSIGERLETEMRCMYFEKNHKAYFELTMKYIDENDIMSYSHKRKTISAKMRKMDHGITWGTAIKVGVGAKVLQMIELVLADILYIKQIQEGKKAQSLLMTTGAFDSWCGEFEREKGLLEPSMLPLKIAPMDWDGNGEGGYYTHQMQLRFPFIKTKGREHREFVEKYVPTQHIAAVNKIQKTEWIINRAVLKVVEQVFKQGLGWGMPSAIPTKIPAIPEELTIVPKEQYDEEQWEEFKYWKAQAKAAHREESKRKGKALQFSQTLRLAQELADWEKFYFAYSCDFRGRVYCATTCLSPQSDTIARSLLKFKEEVKLGQDGIAWLALHGANQWGIKGTYEQRLAWVNETGNSIAYHVALDPIVNNYWIQADEPYTFLAWCLEWAKCEYGANPEATSNLVVGIDGSCNGLQHFSAILRDPVGARATNLCDDREPQDIYQEVADCVTTILKKNSDGVAELWIEVGVDRSTTKRQCMTLPYGATQQSCREYTYEWVKENWSKFDLPDRHRWKMAAYLSPIVWEAIGRTVVAARVAMEWLQRNSGKRYAKWISMVGFPVYQFYKKVKTERVDTRLAGKTKLTIHNMDRTGEPNTFKQRLGIVPNFIHSVDASHMVMTINETELPAYSMIHDEFGCHAGHVPSLYSTTRQTFYKLHYYNNPLEMWAVHQGIPLECVPQRGTFDIAEVLRSKYIFG